MKYDEVNVAYKVHYNWKPSACKITIAPLSYEIRIHLAEETDWDIFLLEKTAKKAYKHWVKNQQQTKTIRARPLLWYTYINFYKKKRNNKKVKLLSVELED